MIHDSIVAEVRAIRERLAAECDFDIRRIVAEAQQRQATSGARLVSPPAVTHPAQQDAEPDRKQAGALSLS